VEFQFQYTDQELQQLAKLVYQHHPTLKNGFRLFRLIGAIMCVGAIANTFVTREKITDALTTLLFGLFFVALPYVLQAYSLSTFRNNVLLKSIICIEADENSFIEKSDAGTVDLQWHVFDSWIETNEFFALVRQPNHNARWLPKRAMSDDEVVELRKLLVRFISKKA